MTNDVADRHGQSVDVNADSLSASMVLASIFHTPTRDVPPPPASSSPTSAAPGEAPDAAKMTALCRLFAADGGSDEILEAIQQAKLAGATTEEIAQVLLAAWEPVDPSPVEPQPAA
ncbi:MAG: hypothetical protein QOG53_3133 [Frankiales bacterium]|nr:hypothetical protein [Frankiales bacterium]